MVALAEIGDKQSQQRRGRADGAIRSVADRSAVEENRALTPETPQASPWWPPVDRESPCAGRHSLDSAERRSLARPSGEISAPFDVLAAAARLGGTGVWLQIWRAFLRELNQRQQLDWSESFLDGSFAPAKKRGAEVGKTKRGKGRSGWWWSTAAEFLWGTTFVLRPRRKSGSRRRRSRRST